MKILNQLPVKLSEIYLADLKMTQDKNVFIWESSSVSIEIRLHKHRFVVEHIRYM